MKSNFVKVGTIFIIALFALPAITSIAETPEDPWNDAYDWNNWYPNIQLPDDTDLQMYVTYATETYFDIEINGVDTQSDISNGTYAGWCFQKNINMARDQWHDITMYHTYDPDKPDQYKNANWDIINYIINHREGATREEVQDAIWYFMEGFPTTTTGSKELINEASAYGPSFCPVPGQKIAIIVNLTSEGRPDTPPVQRAFIEIVLNTYEGETPKFWLTHPEHWIYDQNSCTECEKYTDPSTKIYEIFSVFPPTSVLGSRTILETLQRDTLLPRELILRESIAALLNCCNPNVTYPLECSQIIDAINFEFANDPATIWWGYGMFRMFSILFYYNHLGAL